MRPLSVPRPRRRRRLVLTLLALSLAVDEAGFNSLFPPGSPVVINYHGYVGQVASLLFNRAHSVGRTRFSIHGYKEVGSTTTPFMMLALNDCDRFTLARDALRMGASLSSSSSFILLDERGA